MKNMVRIIVSRTSLILLLLLAQIVLFFVVIDYIANVPYIQFGLYAISVIIVLYLIAKEENPVYKLSWIVPILVFPIFGGFFYLFYRQRNLSKKVLDSHFSIDLERASKIDIDPTIQKTRDMIYLEKLNWPCYQNTTSHLLRSDLSFLDGLLSDLRSAEKFIFIEFFIIKKGHVWQKVLSVLKEKAEQGVEVKLIYDDFGCSGLPYRYPKKLSAFNIDAIAFNPMRLHLNFAMNYRDHRKIIVIDGKVGYTGGMNLSDEYINLYSPFGHWQDAMVRIEGDAVWSLSLIFLENYRFSSHKIIDVLKYKVSHPQRSSGTVIPFSDTPLDKELTTKNIYISMIADAKSSILITSPYLIIDHELTNILKFASKSGVDVSIIIPKIPDKKIILIVTESYIPELVEAGVKIYRYTPGFIHSKMMIIDGKKALFGTANLDFRSLYLHFENSIYYENDPVISEMQSFFEDSRNASELIEHPRRRGLIYKLIQMLLRGFSPLL